MFPSRNKKIAVTLNNAFVQNQFKQVPKLIILHTGSDLQGMTGVSHYAVCIYSPPFLEMTQPQNLDVVFLFTHELH